jgi:hypothetical protein
MDIEQASGQGPGAEDGTRRVAASHSPGLLDPIDDRGAVSAGNGVTAAARFEVTSPSRRARTKAARMGRGPLESRKKSVGDPDPTMLLPISPLEKARQGAW